MNFQFQDITKAIRIGIGIRPGDGQSLQARCGITEWIGRRPPAYDGALTLNLGGRVQRTKGFVAECANLGAFLRRERTRPNGNIAHFPLELTPGKRGAITDGPIGGIIGQIPVGNTLADLNAIAIEAHLPALQCPGEGDPLP